MKHYYSFLLFLISLNICSQENKIIVTYEDNERWFDQFVKAPDSVKIKLIESRILADTSTFVNRS